MRQPKISAHFAARPAPAPSPCAPEEDYAFVDLFAGLGGASQGATEAGLRVVLAVDVCAKMLDIHAQNHPEATHICTELPPTRPLPLPTQGKWHLHGSPPCNQVSRINMLATDEQRKRGLFLVRWYLKYALASGATSWSMEQVPDRGVVRVVEKMRRKHRGRLDYCVINCWNLGVPQTRKRLIAGTPSLIDKLRRRRAVRCSVEDVVAKPGGTHTRIETTGSGPVTRRRANCWDSFCRPISRPAATVTASHGLRWAAPGSGIRPFPIDPCDLLLLQSFPEDYKLCGYCNTFTRRGIGNALPPRAMCELLRPLGVGGK